MKDALQRSEQLALAPLGPGDLIDRAVRFYRGNFFTFVMIAAPPVVIGTIISLCWTALGESLFAVGNGYDPLGMTAYYAFAWLGSLVIWFIEMVVILTVMGGASRSFVRHLLFGEAITVRETYRNALSRIFGLLFASGMITALLSLVGLIVFYIGIIIAVLTAVAVAAVLAVVPPLAFLIGTAAVVAVIAVSLWLFFLVAARFVYVPQVMLVEGLGVWAAVSRSSSLASGSVKRLAALVIFSIVAIYAALAIFYVPLTWYAWQDGVEFLSYNRDTIPAWYEIAAQLIWQASVILMAPVAMIGLCLLYVDDRVRHEGYDIELMAARRLGEIPAVPADYLNPLQPALAANVNSNAAPPPTLRPAARQSPTSILGLD